MSATHARSASLSVRFITLLLLLSATVMPASLAGQEDRPAKERLWIRLTARGGRLSQRVDCRTCRNPDSRPHSAPADRRSTSVDVGKIARPDRTPRRLAAASRPPQWSVRGPLRSRGRARSGSSSGVWRALLRVDSGGNWNRSRNRCEREDVAMDAGDVRYLGL